MKFLLQILIFLHINFFCSVSTFQQESTFVFDAKIPSVGQYEDEVDDAYNLSVENGLMGKEYDYSSISGLELNISEILRKLDYGDYTDSNLLIKGLLKISSEVVSDEAFQQDEGTDIHNFGLDEANAVNDIPENNIVDHDDEIIVNEADTYYDYDSLKEAELEDLDSDYPENHSDDSEYSSTTLLEVINHDYDGLESTDTEDSETLLDRIGNEHQIFTLLFYLGLIIMALMIACSVISFCVCLRDRRDSKNNFFCQHMVKKNTLVPTIVKSYARLPVDIRNMKQSNVAYQELYNV